MMLGIYTSKKINHHQIRESLGKLNWIMYNISQLVKITQVSYIFPFFSFHNTTIIFLEFYAIV